MLLVLWPPFQTAVVRHFGSALVEDFVVAEVAVGFDGVRLKGVEATLPDKTRLEAAEIIVATSLWALRDATELKFKEVSVKGLVVDQREVAEKDPDDQEPPSWPTEFPSMELPLPLFVEKLHLEGRWLGRGDLVATWNLSAAEVRPDHTSELTGIVSWKTPDGAVEVDQFAVSIFQTATGTLQDPTLRARGLLSARALTAPQSLDLDLRLSEPTPQQLAAQLRLTIAQEERVTLSAGYDFPAQRLSVDTEVKVDETLLLAAVGGNWPKFALSLGVKGTLEASTGAIDLARLGLQAESAEPGVLFAPMGSLGPIKIATELRGQYSRSGATLMPFQFRVDRADATASAGAEPLFALTLQRELRLTSEQIASLTDGTATTAAILSDYWRQLLPGPVAAVVVSPVALEPWSALVPGLHVNPAARATLNATATLLPDGSLRLAAPAGSPLLALNALTLGWQGQPMLSELSTALNASLTLGTSGVTVDVQSLRSATPRGEVAEISGSVATSWNNPTSPNANLKLRANLPRLLAQPALTEAFLVPVRGQADLDLALTAAPTTGTPGPATPLSAKARLVVTDLLTAKGVGLAERWETSLDADIEPTTAAVDFRLGSTLLPGLRAPATDLTMALRLAQGGASVNGTISADRLHLEPWQALANGLLKPRPAPTTPAVSRPSRTPLFAPPDRRTTTPSWTRASIPS